MTFHLNVLQSPDALSSDNDLVMMFEEAFKKQPTNEDLGVQTFFANVRAGNWKSAHQASC